MVHGFNTNLSCDQHVYHIQSEDLGGDHAQIVTLAYREGAVVARMQINYREVLGPNPSPEAVRTLMARQHRHMIESIQAGSIEEKEGI
jgi:hypothetical protein